MRTVVIIAICRPVIAFCRRDQYMNLYKNAYHILKKVQKKNKRKWIFTWRSLYAHRKTSIFQQLLTNECLQNSQRIYYIIWFLIDFASFRFNKINCRIIIYSVVRAVFFFLFSWENKKLFPQFTTAAHRLIIIIMQHFKLRCHATSILFDVAFLAFVAFSVDHYIWMS